MCELHKIRRCFCVCRAAEQDPAPLSGTQAVHTYTENLQDLQIGAGQTVSDTAISSEFADGPARSTPTGALRVFGAPRWRKGGGSAIL